MGDHGDGRLELDELGAVIDNASSLDPTPPVDLLTGSDVPTWRERLDASGLTPWLRRHRTAGAAVAAVVALLGLSVTAWVRTRPPAPMAAVAVTVDDVVSDEARAAGVGEAGDGTFTAVYRATPQRPGDTVRILGLEGPGVRASTAHAHSDTAAQDGSTTADIAVVVGCDDPRVATATAADFLVRVEETDSYGRSTAGLVALPPASAGQWVDATVAPCVQQQLSERVVATKVDVISDLRARTITAGIDVHNGYDHDVTIASAPGQGSAVFVSSELFVVAQGQNVSVPIRMRVTDCSNPHLDQAYVPNDDRHRPSRQVPGVNLFVGIDDVPNGFGGSLVVPFSRAAVQQETALLDAICRGVPAVTTTVVTARGAPIDPAAEFPSYGDPSVIALRMTLDVTTAAQHVDLQDGVAREEIERGALPTIHPAAADVRNGHALLTVDWAALCSTVTSPPVVQLDVTSGSLSWPVRATLADKRLLDAYRVACPGVQDSDVSGMGWSTG